MKTRIFTFIVLGIVAYLFGVIYVDPDFGWRVRLGSYILSSGIPQTDIYSYTMPSFPFVDHEWATHIVMHLVHTTVGYGGLAVIATLIYIATVWFSTRTFSPSWRLAHILFVGSVLFHHYGIKPQIISWLMTAILVNATLSRRWHTKWRLWVPAFLVVWANIHGGFVVGVGIVTLKVLADAVSEKRILKSDLLLLFTSLLATLVNPYGIRLWEEIVRTGSDTRLRLQILEWTPQFLYFNLSSFLLVGWYLTIFLKYYKSCSLYTRALVILLLIFGFSSSRNFPLWVVAASPIIGGLFESFIKDTRKNKITMRRMERLRIVFTVFILCVALFELFFLSKEMYKYSESEKYPKNAITYLRSNPSAGNVLAAYEWGGYLIQHYPEKKVFIDGRMPSWRQDISRHPAESPDAFAEFTAFLAQTKPMKPMLTKYNIDTIILPRTLLEPNAFKKNTETIRTFNNSLRKNGFEQVYSDEVAIVFR